MATSLLPPYRRASDPDEPATEPAVTALWALAPLTALRAAVASFVVVALVVVLGWAGARTSAGAGAAIRAAAQVWLVANHVPLRVPGGTVGLTPLGLLALPALSVGLATRSAARRATVGGVGPTTGLLALISTCYGGVVTAVSGLSANDTVSSSPAWSFSCGFALAGLAGAIALLTTAGGQAAVARRVPASWRAVLAAACAGTAALVAGGAALAGISVVLHFSRVTQVAEALDPGVLGGLLLALLGVVLVPNAAVWGGAFVVGPGFAVGEQTSVTPLGASVGPVPGLPLLGAVPGPGAFPDVLLVVFVVPMMAGVAVAMVLRRRRARYGLPVQRPVRAATTAAAGGAAAGVGLGLLAALAGGPFGGGHLSAVGPSPWQVAVAGGIEVAAFAAALTWALAPHGRDALASALRARRWWRHG